MDTGIGGGAEGCGTVFRRQNVWGDWLGAAINEDSYLRLRLKGGYSDFTLKSYTHLSRTPRFLDTRFFSRLSRTPT